MESIIGNYVGKCVETASLKITNNFRYTIIRLCNLSFWTRFYVWYLSGVALLSVRVYLWWEFLCMTYVGRSIPATSCFWQPDLLLIQWSTDNNHCAAIPLYPAIPTLLWPCYTLPCFTLLCILLCITISLPCYVYICMWVHPHYCDDKHCAAIRFTFVTSTGYYPCFCYPIVHPDVLYLYMSSMYKLAVHTIKQTHKSIVFWDEATYRGQAENIFDDGKTTRTLLYKISPICACWTFTGVELAAGMKRRGI